MANAEDLAAFIGYVECLNEEDGNEAKKCLREGLREDVGAFLRSDCDEQLLLSISFTQPVKLHSLSIAAHGQSAGAAPRAVKLFVNSVGLSFEDAESAPGAQKLELSAAQVAEGARIPLQIVRFQSVSSLTIFVGSNQDDEDQTCIGRLCLWGSPVATTNMKNFGKQGEQAGAQPAPPLPPLEKLSLSAGKDSVGDQRARGGKIRGREAHFAPLEEDRVRDMSVDFIVLSESPQALCDILATHGAAIVTGVLPPEEVRALNDAWSRDLYSTLDPEHSTDAAAVRAISADPVNAWDAKKMPLGGNFVSEFGLPHGQLGWGVRKSERVRRVYEALYDEKDLVVGMDNIFFNNEAPPQADDKNRTTTMWPHADLNNKLPSGQWRVYQSVVYIWSCDLNSSCTVVWPGSHLTVFPELMKVPHGNGHFCRCPESWNPQFVQHARRIPVPAGGMLVWDSRTIHQGWPLGRRLAVPVCFEPCERRGAEALVRKEQCVVDGIATTHWASLGVRGGSETFHHGIVLAGGVALKHCAHKHCVDLYGDVNPDILKLL